MVDDLDDGGELSGGRTLCDENNTAGLNKTPLRALNGGNFSHWKGRYVRRKRNIRRELIGVDCVNMDEQC